MHKGFAHLMWFCRSFHCSETSNVNRQMNCCIITVLCEQSDMLATMLPFFQNKWLLVHFQRLLFGVPRCCCLVQTLPLFWHLVLVRNSHWIVLRYDGCDLEAPNNARPETSIRFKGILSSQSRVTSACRWSTKKEHHESGLNYSFRWSGIHWQVCGTNTTKLRGTSVVATISFSSDVWRVGFLFSAGSSASIPSLSYLHLIRTWAWS